MRAGAGDASDHLLIVLSADEACFERVRCLHTDWHAVAVKWTADPAQLVRVRIGGERDGDRMLVAGIVDDGGQVSGPIVGIVLDLSESPHDGADGRRHPTPAAATRGMPLEWPIGAVLTVADEPMPPVLLVSDAPLVESALRRHGVDVVERIGPRDAEPVWQQAVHRLIACAEHTQAAEVKPGFVHDSTPQSAPFEPLLSLLPAPIRLRPDLAFDASNGQLIGPDGETRLTARESELLGILLHIPGVQYSADQLAQKLSHSAPYPVSQQSVLQAVCDLRPKLGDTGRPSRILVHRRGYGYAIMIGHADEVRFPVLAHPAAAAVAVRV